MMKQMAENLARVKQALKKWIPLYKAHSQREIIEIENDISNLVTALDNSHPSKAQLEELKSLEAHKLDWLEKEETSWRLKSRALWLEAGDNNTRFFHQYANYRKNINTIWDIKNVEGVKVNSFKEKAEAGAQFFESQFRQPEGCPIQEILSVVSKFPVVFTEEMNQSMEAEISDSEIHDALFSMQNGKSLGPDGFTVEFFKHFYDLLKNDLLKVVTESKNNGRVINSFNSTFICLIPKTQKGDSFSDYRPISCCNVIYKLISKVIAHRLKPLMSEFIGEEQFGFLHNRQIHDAVTVAQETLHSVKQRKLKATLLKLDLTKAYDRVNWTFLRLALLQLGLNLNSVNWIMGCLQSVSFVVLINGSPSRFFKASRGLRQGCPLSPFFCF
jgi:hypothetical protein